jgi:hypothetical protein
VAKGQESKGTVNDRILIATAPDDILHDGFRILAVDLDHLQSEIVSSSLLELSQIDVILYVWTSLDNVEWLLDKKNKSDLIIFNAESSNQTIAGYMAAQSKSCYFGTLRDLNSVNNHVLLDKHVCCDTIKTSIGKYERKFK